MTYYLLSRVITRNPNLARTIHLMKGIYPILYSKKCEIDTGSPLPSTPLSNKTHEMAAWQMDVDERITHGLEKALEMGLCRKGDPVICVQGWRAGSGTTNCMRILEA
jgi:pyruvate kinase